MKRRKRIVPILFAAVTMMISLLATQEVQAGVNEMILDESTLEGNSWSDPEGDVIIEEGVLRFSKESTEYTRFISKSVAKKEEGFENIVKLSASLDFKTLPNEKSFIVGVGLQGIETLPGEPGNVEIAFINKGNIQVGVTAYDMEGNKIVVSNPQTCGITRNKPVKIEVLVGTDSSIQVLINGRKLVSEQIPVTGEGRVGFMQTGSCEVTVTKLNVTHYQYDRPENPNVYEDFEQGCMNSSNLTAKVLSMYNVFPRGQLVEEYEGNQVLRFRNTFQAYVGTTHKYSNFELTFDVPFMQMEQEFDENGVQTAKKQMDIMLSFGGEQADFDVVNGWTYSADTILFTDWGVVYSNSDPESIRGELTRDPFKEDGRPFSIKLKVVDGTVSVGIKWLEEKNYQTVLQYKLSGGMPTGYVHIWTPYVGSMAIDNIRVTNLDSEPNLIETEFKSGDLDDADAVYEPMERIYSPKEDNDKKIPVPFVILGVAIGISLVSVITTVCFNRNKKQREKI